MTGFLEPEKLLLIPPLIIILVLVFKIQNNHHTKRVLSLYETYDVFLNNSTFSPRLRTTSQYLIILVVSLLTISLARPYSGFTRTTETRPVQHVSVLLDLSESMRAKEQSSTRLDVAVNLLQELATLNDSVLFSLYSFTEQTYVECDPTYDMYSFMEGVYDVQQTGVPQQGSNLAQALQYIDSFPPKEIYENSQLLILTDGEFHAGDLTTKLKQLNKSFTPFYLAGLGTSDTIIATKAGKKISTPRHKSLKADIENHGGRYHSIGHSSNDSLIIHNWINQISPSLLPHEKGLRPNELSSMLHFIAFVLFSFSILIPKTRKKHAALKYLCASSIIFVAKASSFNDSTKVLTRHLTKFEEKVATIELRPSRSYSDVQKLRLELYTIAENVKKQAPTILKEQRLGTLIKQLTSFENRIETLTFSTDKQESTKPHVFDTTPSGDMLNSILFREKIERQKLKDALRKKQGIKDVEKPW